MVFSNYRLCARALADEARARLGNNSAKEKETDKFFYYCLSRLAWEMNSSSEPKKSCMVHLVQDFSYSDTVLLRHGRISNYSSTFVTAYEFYSIMQKVADIFNDASMENYRAICDDTPGHASLILFLENLK